MTTRDETQSHTDAVRAQLREVVDNDVQPKTFSTGSRGFAASNVRVTIDGRRYMINVQAVEIGSKKA